MEKGRALETNDERRTPEGGDRRARKRGGRRQEDAKKPWYLKCRWWLAAASLVYVGWRQMRKPGHDK